MTSKKIRLVWLDRAEIKLSSNEFGIAFFNTLINFWKVLSISVDNNQRYKYIYNASMEGLEFLFHGFRS